MEPSTQKLIHTFGALADLGQEVANTGDFNEMVRTSLHLLLGTLALRRGAVAECNQVGTLGCVAIWGLNNTLLEQFSVRDEEKRTLLAAEIPALLVRESDDPFIHRHYDLLTGEGIELVVPMIVRQDLTGFVLLGGKASGEEFSAEDFETIRAMVRHIGVGIHTHRLIEQVAQRAEENRRLYEELRAIYRDTVRAFAAAIDIKDKYTQGHSERVGRYSEIIARELGWCEEEVEGIQIAGYLHDVGKLITTNDWMGEDIRMD
jgi:GAF domain-containing protein